MIHQNCLNRDNTHCLSSHLIFSPACCYDLAVLVDQVSKEFGASLVCGAGAGAHLPATCSRLTAPCRVDRCRYPCCHSCSQGQRAKSLGHARVGTLRFTFPVSACAQGVLPFTLHILYQLKALAASQYRMPASCRLAFALCRHPIHSDLRRRRPLEAQHALFEAIDEVCSSTRHPCPYGCP